MQQLESPQQPRGLVVAGKPGLKTSRVDKLFLWLSKSQTIDGLWVGTTESGPHAALHRVEDALRLIKRHDPLNYSRVIRNLDRIWVNLIPSAEAHYERSLNACILDERYVLKQTMTLEKIASTIVHEATHARLGGWGIIYEEKIRSRIEAICLRRELNFLTKLPDGGSLREEIEPTLGWLDSDQDHFSDASFRKREELGQVEMLRYLSVPDWLVNTLMRFVRRRRLRAVASRGR